MADVTLFDVAQQAETSRGQLFLVGALALAVTFVVLALIMNGVIYTENVSARDLATSSTPVIEYEGEAKSVGERLLRDERGGPYSEMGPNVTTGMANWSNTIAPFDSVEGHITGIQNSSVRNGTALVQENSTRNFTDTSASPSWRLTANVSDGVNSREGRINATPEEYLDPVSSDQYGNLTNVSGPFHVNVTDTNTRTDTVFVYTNGTDNETDVCISVFEDELRKTTECVDGETIRVNFVTGDYATDSVNGSMSELRIFERVGPGHHIEFGNGNKSTGTYTFIVAAENQTITSAVNHGMTAEDPHTERLLYDLEFRVEYRTANLHYESVVRIAPGEPNYD